MSDSLNGYMGIARHVGSKFRVFRPLLPSCPSVHRIAKRTRARRLSLFIHCAETDGDSCNSSLQRDRKLRNEPIPALHGRSVFVLQRKSPNEPTPADRRFQIPDLRWGDTGESNGRSGFCETNPLRLECEFKAPEFNVQSYEKCETKPFLESRMVKSMNSINNIDAGRYDDITKRTHSERQGRMK
jgi:hypothetical protein